MNTNCLKDFKCPACQYEDDFFIQINQIAHMTDRGVLDIQGDNEYRCTSYCRCGECGHEGNVGDFCPEEEDHLVPAPSSYELMTRTLEVLLEGKICYHDSAATSSCKFCEARFILNRAREALQAGRQ